MARDVQHIASRAVVDLVRQLVPSATTIASAAAPRIFGGRSSSAIFIDTS